MTREELRDYVEKQRELGNLPYHVYSTLIDEIDTLEQEPCEDVVSRKTIDQNIYDYAESNGLSYANLKNAILDAPSVALEQKWIPVTERLPEEKGLYLGSVKNDHNRRYSKTCWFHGGDNWFARQDVLAWMPLPKPYKAESEDKDDNNNQHN